MFLTLAKNQNPILVKHVHLSPSKGVTCQSTSLYVGGKVLPMPFQCLPPVLAIKAHGELLGVVPPPGGHTRDHGMMWIK